MSCGNAAVIEAAANVAWALCNSGRPAELCFALSECNSLGAAMMGAPSFESVCCPVHGINGNEEMSATTVILLENDLYQHADAGAVDRFLAAAQHVVVVDHTAHQSSARANVVLPASTFAEADGTMVNNEGRAQRFFQVFVPQDDIQESWRWVQDIMTIAGRAKNDPWLNLDDVTAACAREIPGLQPILSAAPTSEFRIHDQKIPREPHRYSGRTAMLANISVHEPEPPEDTDTPFSFSMEGYLGHPPPALIPRFWAPGWNSVQAVNKFQDEVGGSLSGGDPGVRLIEPAADAGIAYFTNIPRAFKRRADEWLIVPLRHIFGTEPLSALAPPIAELAAKPYLALNSQDAAELGLAAGNSAQLQLDRKGTVYTVPVLLRAELQRGVAGLPVGLPGLAGIALPAWGKVTKIGEEAAP
jgi:NADH-quinone oxidoreductase subunit G